MPASVIEAESLIFPNLSRMESMRRSMAGKVTTSSVSLCSAGYLYSFCAMSATGSVSCSSASLRYFTMLAIVSIDRLRSHTSSSSRCVPSRRMRLTASLTSKKYCIGKLSFSCCSLRNSYTCRSHSLISAQSVENAISSTFSLPSVLRQRSFSSLRISSNPSLCSKLFG